MPKILVYGSYAVFVLSERGQRHHLPHAHIKQRGNNIASIFLISLEVFDAIERLPPNLVRHICDHQAKLLAAWEDLNGD
jgi:hypothetical protein